MTGNKRAWKGDCKNSKPSTKRSNNVERTILDYLPTVPCCDARLPPKSKSCAASPAEQGEQGFCSLQNGSAPTPVTPVDQCQASGSTADNRPLPVAAAPTIRALPKPFPLDHHSAESPHGGCRDACATYPHSPFTSFGDVMETMLTKEMGFHKDPGYLRFHSSINSDMRVILLDWMMEVCETYCLTRSSFYLAVDMVDRYLSKSTDTPKNRLQLLGTTALFVAAKQEEVVWPKSSAFVYVTDNACTLDDLLGQEAILLDKLDWRTTVDTPITFVMLYLQWMSHSLSQSDEFNWESPTFNTDQFLLCCRLLDLVMFDISSLQFRASMLAASAVCALIGLHALDFTSYKEADIDRCLRWMTPYVRYVQAMPSPVLVDRPNVDSSDLQHLQDYHKPWDEWKAIWSSADACRGIDTTPSTTTGVASASGYSEYVCLVPATPECARGLPPTPPRSSGKASHPRS